MPLLWLAAGQIFLASHRFLSSLTQWVSQIHSEYAPNWPLEFNRILEELPVDISCSFLNQLKGPHDAGHGV